MFKVFFLQSLCFLQMFFFAGKGSVLVAFMSKVFPR